MGDPVTATLVIAAASGVLTAGSMVQSGQQARSAANYNAAVARENAKAAELQAAERAKRIRSQGKSLLAKQRALYGASGVDLMFGSPLLVLADTAGQIELEAQDAIFAGKTQAAGLRSEAGGILAEGRAKTQAANIGAFSSLLSTGAKMYGIAGIAGEK